MTLAVGDETYRWSVYALGMNAPDTEDPATSADREAVSRFVNEAPGLLGDGTDAVIAEPDAFAVSWIESDPGAADPSIDVDVRPWPESFPSPAGVSCVEVDGDLVRAELGDATQATYLILPAGSSDPATSDALGEVEVLPLVRALLPGSEGC
ncbi:MAG: hypothetical protein R2705_01850 [Ilumatobacteraceae bacterium]